MKTALTTIAAPRCRLMASVLGLTMVGLMSQSALAEAGTSAAGAGRAVVLQTFRAGQFALDLAIATCRQSECPIDVRLRSGGRAVDHVRLPIAASSQRATAETADAVCGAEAGRKAWATGKENDYVSTAARLLRIARRTTALLVSQCFGFEHVKRNHLLLVPRAGKLVVAWEAGEGQGPTWSATEVVGSAGSNRQEVAYSYGFLEPEEDIPERLDLIRLSWSAAAARVQETPLPAPTMPLYLLDLGTHDTAAQARQARAANDCVSSYWVLDAGRFRADASGKALIGMLYASCPAANRAARSVERCLPGANALVVTIAPR